MYDVRLEIARWLDCDTTSLWDATLLPHLMHVAMDVRVKLLPDLPLRGRTKSHHGDRESVQAKGRGTPEMLLRHRQIWERRRLFKKGNVRAARSSRRSCWWRLHQPHTGKTADVRIDHPNLDELGKLVKDKRLSKEPVQLYRLRLLRHSE